MALIPHWRTRGRQRISSKVSQPQYCGRMISCGRCAHSRPRTKAIWSRRKACSIASSAIAILRRFLRDSSTPALIGATGTMAVIAHELGHHFCGHIGHPASPHHEIEADRFAGAALRNSGMSLDQALSVAEIFSNRPSRSLPGKAERMTAIADGWNNPASARHCR